MESRTRSRSSSSFSATSARTTSATSRVFATPSMPAAASRASANSSALWNRRSGFLLSAFITTSSYGSSSGHRLEGLTTVSFKRRLRVAALVSPLNSRRPVRHSHKMIPALKRSERWSVSLDDACSGAMYESLPLNWPARVDAIRTSAFATPKSVSRPIPSVPTRMLWGETSRWTSLSGRPFSSASRCAAPSP